MGVRERMVKPATEISVPVFLLAGFDGEVGPRRVKLFLEVAYADCVKVVQQG